MKSLSALLGSVGVSAALLGQISFSAMGVVQLLAIMDGIQLYWEMSGFLSFLIASALGFFPLIGAVLGGLAAVQVWGWSSWGAFLLFGWPLPLILLILLSGGAAQLGARMRRG
ncbi:hypothetical protein [Falsiroseomonas sp. E2-1-a20]|uniref:hypothetical protein n=1 Tax=Falsiroseomonas sp. E2-1-a20 TaxID=3239300 RepID=UPI003F3A1327